MNKLVKYILLLLMIVIVGYIMMIISERPMLTQRNRHLSDDCITNEYVYSVQTSESGIDEFILNNQLEKAMGLNDALKDKYKNAQYTYFYYEYNLARIEMKRDEIRNANIHFSEFNKVDYCNKYRHCSINSFNYCVNAHNQSKEYIRLIKMKGNWGPPYLFP